MSTMSDEERRQIEELLPWYAAGTLDRSDMRRVEEALEKDADLARSYGHVREELAGTVHLNESLGAPSPRAMEKLFAKIDAEPVGRPALARGIADRLSSFLESLSPRTLAWSASAAALLILLQAGIIGSAVFNPQFIYGTASAPSATREPAFAIVRFAPQASAADIDALLEANKVTIAGGPSAGGLYRLRATEARKEDLAKLIEQLSQDKSVSFIAPSE